MNLVFVSEGQYPGGSASSNRHLAYAKGLVELVNKVTFILLAPQNNADQSFTLDGINFICVSVSKSKLKHSSIEWIFSIFRSDRKGEKLISDITSEEKVDAVILLDVLVFILYPFLRFCNKRKIPVFHERTEFPVVYDNHGVLDRLHQKIYLSQILPRFDGIFVINHALKKYFEEVTNNKIPVSIVNMVVDPSRFASAHVPKAEASKYLAYCGSMDIEKDGVDILIRSFGKAINESGINKEIYLMLIGDTTDVIRQNKLNRIIEESNCVKNVILTGSVKRQRIPELLTNADALALARPNSKQAEGGFPTKLGEYLSTGKPVIITNTGEIGLFLKDGHNAFIAEAGSIDSFSKKIRQVFDNYNDAIKVGLNGKNLVYNEFNYLHQAKCLSDFIKSII